MNLKKSKSFIFLSILLIYFGNALVMAQEPDLEALMLRKFDERKVGPPIDAYNQGIEAELAALRQNRGKADIPGVQVHENGEINVDGAVRPDLIKMERAFKIFALDYKESEAARQHYTRKLLERGFRHADLVHLNALENPEPDPESLADACLREKFKDDPLGNIMEPTVTLERISDADIKGFLERYYLETQAILKDLLTGFLEQLSPHSGRAFVSVLLTEVTDGMGVVYYPTDLPDSHIESFRRSRDLQRQWLGLEEKEDQEF